MPHTPVVQRQPAADGGGETAIPAEVEQEILREISRIEYGSVEVVVHNAKVIQIEVRKKRRFGDTGAVR